MGNIRHIATYDRFADGHLQGNPVPCFHVSKIQTWRVEKKSSGKLEKNTLMFFFGGQPGRRWPRSKMRPMFQFHCWTCRSSWIQREGAVESLAKSCWLQGYRKTDSNKLLDTTNTTIASILHVLLEPNDFLTRSSTCTWNCDKKWVTTIEPGKLSLFFWVLRTITLPTIETNRTILFNQFCRHLPWGCHRDLRSGRCKNKANLRKEEETH